MAEAFILASRGGGICRSETEVLEEGVASAASEVPGEGRSETEILAEGIASAASEVPGEGAALGGDKVLVEETHDLLLPKQARYHLRS